MQLTDSTTVLRVYQLARVVSSVLRENDILFWTSGGTTLGICRHRGLIPWDDDVDFCIPEQVSFQTKYSKLYEDTLSSGPRKTPSLVS